MEKNNRTMSGRRREDTTKSRHRRHSGVAHVVPHRSMSMPVVHVQYSQDGLQSAACAGTLRRGVNAKKAVFSGANSSSIVHRRMVGIPVFTLIILLRDSPALALNAYMKSCLPQGICPARRSLQRKSII
jgi:hypothetical protein